jgi:hypothetical protein
MDCFYREGGVHGEGGENMKGVFRTGIVWMRTGNECAFTTSTSHCMIDPL